MDKKSIIILIVFAVISAIFIVFGDGIYSFLSDKYEDVSGANSFVYGEAVGEKGKIALKLKVDNSGAIKEVVVTEHSDSEIAVNALQKLIDSSLDKQSADEIDSVSGATDTSNTYKSIIDRLLIKQSRLVEDENTEKVSLSEPDIQYLIERRVVNTEGFKSGIGGYVFNTFRDADYNRNGDLVTNE